MSKHYKAIIIGTSLTGKTTLISHLRKTSDLQVEEIDELLMQLNGGSFPKDDEYKNTVLAPKIIQDILAKENILFFTNAHYFTIPNLQAARKKGFKIIQLILDKEELKKRNILRMKNEGYEDHSQWFDSMLHYQKEIFDKGMVDTVIETDKQLEDIARELMVFLTV